VEYPKPGDRIAHPRPRIFDVEAGRPIEVSEDLFPNPWSLSEFVYSEDGRHLRFLYNERGHQVLRIVDVDVEAGSAHAFLEERSDTFVDYSQKSFLRWLPGGETCLWMSERSGFNHLYVAGDGTLEPLTEGPWLVRRVLDVDTTSGTVTFEALGVHPEEDPYHVHVGRVALATKEVTWLTEGDGTHELSFSPDGRAFVDRWSRVDLPPVHELRRTHDGALVCRLAEADWAPLVETGWAAPERFHAKGRDGTTDVWGLIFRPTNFDPAARYPVVEEIYAGPHGHFVPKAFDGWHGSRRLAELGFVVVRIDGMGTNWRSRAFHDVCWKNLSDAGLPDRVAWIRAAAATRPWMDLSRVGIWGGSAGGQNALSALLTHGDFYRVGVADCGCHDNRMDKIWWNEAWMGWPVGPEYEAQSNVTLAPRLEGKLLLIVGELDRNVDPASTMQVVDALVRADKDFDLLVMPGVGHGAAGTPYGRRRLEDFFVRHLLGHEPRIDAPADR
jgi:dipeptidyl aminopeptidase/acylaminoacyl peptidase